MPDSHTHRTATRHAVNLTNFKNAENLIETYCLYPDLYYGKDKKAIEPYLFMDGDVGFHDIPASSITELYQFWIPDDKGQLHRGRKYSNASYLFCEKCFRFYFENIKKAIDENRFEDILKFTGCLIHHLQDATFGLHVLEGASGADVYTLNRLSGVDFMSFIFDLKLKEEWEELVVIPRYLGDTVQEAVMCLCAQYVYLNKKSCNALFAIAANRISKNDDTVLNDNVKSMYINAVNAAADVLFTVRSWLEKSAPVRNYICLNSLAPYEPPLGGTGEYRIKMLQVRENELEFGVHFEQNLIYHIAEDIFRDFTAELTAKNTNDVTVNLVNDDKIIETFVINNETKTIKINSPCGVFGLRTSSAQPSGCLILRNGIFNKKDQK